MNRTMHILRAARSISWLVLLLVLSVNISPELESKILGKTSRLEITKDQPTWFVGVIKSKLALALLGGDDGEQVHFPYPACLPGKAVLRSILVSVSKRNFFYTLTTINAP